MVFHNRQSIRLKNYDYSQPGYYFITVCAKNMKRIFGDITVGAGPCAGPIMKLNDVGKMIQTVWHEIPEYYPGVDIDAFVVMPNHVHGIIHLMEASFGIGRARGPARTLSLGDVVHRFKSLTTARYRYHVQHHDWPRFPGRLWQRNYYEHVIRDEWDLNRIREYIMYNPDIWDSDEYNH